MEIAFYTSSMEGGSEKVPDVTKWAPKEEITDPFQRALIQQLQWLNANLWEVRTNLAIISNKMEAPERERGRG